MTNLFIAEKPELARAIASAINGTQSKGEGFMQQRTGKYGAFLVCSNYPNCKNIQKLSA